MVKCLLSKYIESHGFHPQYQKKGKKFFRMYSPNLCVIIFLCVCEVGGSSFVFSPNMGNHLLNSLIFILVMSVMCQISVYL